MPNLPIKTGHIFIGMAVVMGIATVGIMNGSKPTSPKVKTVVETQEVVVPLVSINEGKTLSQNDITTVKWPKAYLPKGSYFTDPFQVVGRIAKQDLYPGEPIYLPKLSGSNTKGGLPALIPDGMRAVTVAVTEIKGVAGFVKPGDRVDILSTFELPKGEGEGLMKTKTVLQDVLVLASAQTMVKDSDPGIDTPEGVTRGEATPVPVDESQKDKNAREKKESAKDAEKRAKEREKEKRAAEKAARLVSSVTVALTPEQSETLALAEETGDLRLVLRPESDRSINPLNGVDSEQLMGRKSAFSAEPPAFVPPPPPAMPPIMPEPMLGAQVEFIQGDNKTIYNFNQ